MSHALYWATPWHQQIGADLGERMQRAFDNGFVNGHGPIIIIGTDLPQLRVHCCAKR
ncbi:MAG: DUF2064 domain-containing protein [Flavobacteriales bacterium]|nr:DUF2064 domain-containing protein [Flavobacteriales bacterium]